jgi:hypothetical protein
MPGVVFVVLLDVCRCLELQRGELLEVETKLLQVATKASDKDHIKAYPTIIH